jgi:hypothetical protein
MIKLHLGRVLLASLLAHGAALYDGLGTRHALKAGWHENDPIVSASYKAMGTPGILLATQVDATALDLLGTTGFVKRHPRARIVACAILAGEHLALGSWNWHARGPRVASGVGPIGIVRPPTP